MITYGSTTLTSYNSIVETEVYYYKSTSPTALSGGSWSTTKPTWENGKYIWQKIRTIYEDETYTESDPVNITGQQGETGTAAYSYKLNASNTIIGKTKTGEYTIDKITFSATSKQGTDAVTAYSGIFKIETTEDGSTWTTSYTSSANESSKEFIIPENIVAVKCSLYQADGLTVLLDIVTIPIVKDGVDAIGLKDSIPYYLASNKNTGVTKNDFGWSRYTPQLTTENKYLWVYYVSRYGEGESEPELIEIRDDIVSFENHGDISPVDNCTMIAPAQDLHGYDAPWTAGGGKNLLTEGFLHSNKISYYFNSLDGTDYPIYLTSGTYTFQIVFKDNRTEYPNLYIKKENATQISIGNTGNNKTFTITESGYYRIWLYASPDRCEPFTDQSFDHFQLELGSTATSWEPYENVCPIEGGFKSNILLYNVKTTDNINDSDPYLFRPIKNVSENGTQEVLNKIIGGSIVWNQLDGNTNVLTRTQADITYTRNETTKILHIEGTATGTSYRIANGASTNVLFDICAGHVYLFCMGNDDFVGSGSTYYAYPATDSSYWESGRNVFTANKILKCIANGRCYFQFTVREGATINIDIRPQVFDLTQMFGSTIADYIYNLETATTGAGVAWFRKYFPKEYYEYNAGEIMSVEGLTSHDTIGFNAWDEEWEIGYFYDTGDTIGQKRATTDRIRSKNYIPCLPNTVYNYNMGGANGRIFFYDKEYNYISFRDYAAAKTFTTPENCWYMMLNTSGTYGTTYNHNICVNLSLDGERNGEYEPHVKHSYPLDPTLTLRGMPVLSEGNLAYDGDIYKADGTVERRYGIVDLGTRNWTVSSSGDNVFYNNIGAKPVNDYKQHGLMSKYSFAGSRFIADMEDKTWMIASNKRVHIRDSSYADAESFKEAMSGVYLVYELEEPTTETAQPYQVSQNIDPYGTEEYITNSIVPVGHETEYVNGNVISVQVPIDEDDLYGGELDLTNGILTINQKLITFNGDSEKENWSSYIPSRYNADTFYITVSDKKIGSFSSFCNSFKNVHYSWSSDGSDKFGVYSDHNSLPRFYFRPPNNTISTIQEWQTWLSNNPVQLCYEIAIPITYQLTSQEVTMFMGQNNIYNNIGQTKIHYYDNQKSTEPYVDNSHTSTLEIAQAAKEVAEAALSQVDGKIETWCQSTDPATAWTTEDLKNQHDGDLWYYTGESTSSFGNNTTYKYIASNNTWTPYSTNIDLFDRIDSKSTIYYGTTTTVTSAENGDYLVDSENDCTYRWNNGAWVLATDYKQVAIDAVDIGGRNLLRNTTEASSKVFIGSSASTITYPESGVVRIAPTTSAQYVKFKVDYLDYDDFKDSTVMVSFDARIANVESTYTTTNNVLVYLGVSLASRVNSLLSSSYDCYRSYTLTGLTTEWQRFSHIYSIPDSFISGKTSALVKGNYLTVEFGESGSRSPIEIRLVKLERGNKATDWTPAPEDAENSIQQMQNDLDNLEIGGRNLMLTPAVSYIPAGYAVYDIKLSEDLLADQTYTLQLWDVDIINSAATEEELGIIVYYCGGLDGIGSWKGTNYFTDGHADYLSLTFTLTTEKITHSDVINASYKFIRLYNRISTAGTKNMSVGRWKLEKGNRGTDWSPAPEDVEEEISNLRIDLQSQIDEKIQTYYQSTNPASSWTTAELRTPHDGDLWYYTGTTTSTYTKDNVYRYNASNNTWSVYSASGELFDKVDGKSTIYYGTTSGTYTGVETGDYLVDSTDGSSYRWDGSNWVKVTDYKTTITNAIDDIEIGSRNLIWRSNWENMSGKWSDWGTPTIREIVTINGKKWLHLKTSGSKYQGYSQNSNQRNGYGEIKEGDNITVSFTAYAAENNITACIGMHWLHPTSGIVNQNWANFTLSTSPTRYSKVFTVRGTEVTGFNIMVGDNSTDIKEIWITDIKAEKGNKATDWTPAPEDTETAISNVQDTANTALNQSVEYIVGTQTAATGSWTGVTNDSVLVTGKNIAYKLPYEGSGNASLTLTLADGTTTGAINVYLNTTRVTTHFKAGSVINMTYDGQYWRITSIPNSDTVVNVIPYFSGKTGTLGIWRYSLFMRDGNGTYQNICTASDGTVTTANSTIETTKKANPNGFEVGSSIWYANGAGYNANTNISGNNVIYSSTTVIDSRYSLNTERKANSLTPYLPIYLIGEIKSDNLFYLDTVWWTQTPTDSSKVYVLIGGCYDSTTSNVRIALYENNGWYKYVNGKLEDYSNRLAELASTTATAYITDTTDNGIMVHPENDTTSGWSIASAIQLFKSGISYIKLWIENNVAKIRIGREDEGHVLIDNDSVDIKNGQNVLASFGSDVTIGRQNYHSYLKLDNAATHVYGYDKQEVLTYGTANDPATGLVQISEAGQIGNSEISGQTTYGIALSYKPVQILSVTIDEDLINLNEISIDERWNWVYVTATQGKKMEVVYTTSTNTPFFRLGSYYKNKSYGINSFGAGRNIEVSGANSGGFGYNTVVKGNNSFACGYNNKVKGNNSFACGENNVIDSTGSRSAIIGLNSKVSHSDTVCMGIELNSTQGNQCIVGTINEEQSHTAFDYFVVGVGDLTDNGGKDGFLVAGADNEYDKGCVGIGLNTSAPSDSTDGQLYRLLQYLGWGDVIF